LPQQSRAPIFDVIGGRAVRRVDLDETGPPNQPEGSCLVDKEMGCVALIILGPALIESLGLLDRHWA